MQLLSTEAEGVNTAIPEEYMRGHVNRDNRVGALLGLTDLRHTAADCKFSTCLTYTEVLVHVILNRIKINSIS